MNTTYQISPTAKLVIDFDYQPGSPGVHTLPNGDPGYPETPETLEITSVQLWTRSAFDAVKWFPIDIFLDMEILNEEFLLSLAEKEIERQRARNEAEREDHDPI